MKIDDRLYGEVYLEDSVLVDIINSKAIERLGKINQYGAIYQVYPRFFTTRKEHSIGVMLLLRSLGASLEEQIAGLIHDVPHTAFSHVADYLLGDDKHEFSYHEIIQREVLAKSDIADVLDKHKFNKEAIFRIDDFPLLERNLPDLCADRCDYILRDLLTYEMITKEEIDLIIKSFVAYKGEIMMSNVQAAKIFAEKVVEANKLIWSSPYQIYLAKILSETIRIALEKKYISLSDLHGTDNALFRKLSSTSEEKIDKYLSLLTDKIVVTLNDDDYLMHVYTKLRVIDPKVFIDNRLERLSVLDSSFFKLISDYREYHSKGFKLNVRKREEGETIN